VFTRALGFALTIDLNRLSSRPNKGCLFLFGDKDDKHNLLWHFLSFSQGFNLGEHHIGAPCPVPILDFTPNNNQVFNQKIEALRF